MVKITTTAAFDESVSFKSPPILVSSRNGFLIIPCSMVENGGVIDVDPAGWKLIDDACDDVPPPTTAVEFPVTICPNKGSELVANVTSAPELSDPL